MIITSLNTCSTIQSYYTTTTIETTVIYVSPHAENGDLVEKHVGHLAKKNNFTIFDILADILWKGIIHVLMRDERRKEERSKQGQTNNEAKQHSTPKAVTFPELPRVGLEPTTLYTLDRALYH